MIEVKVLGTGCANCKLIKKLIEDATSENGIEINLEKVEDMAEIMSYGIMSTPGVINTHHKTKCCANGNAFNEHCFC
jgi:small redox-active disulfide protein 2